MAWQQNHEILCTSTMVPNLGKNTQGNFKSPPDYLSGLLIYTSEVTSLSCVFLNYRTGLKSFLLCRELLQNPQSKNYISRTKWCCQSYFFEEELMWNTTCTVANERWKLKESDNR